VILRIRGGIGTWLSDADLIARAYRKAMDRQELTSQERSAVRRHEKEKEERLRWQYYGSIPQKHWRKMSGRQAKVLIEQADRYGIPFGAANVNLPAVVRALHDFLAENAYKLARDDDPLMQGGGSPALEAYRQERAAMSRMDRLEREGRLVPRDLARETLGRVAATLRSAGDALQREFGPGAVEILNESLDDAQREMERFFGEAADGDGRSKPTSWLPGLHRLGEGLFRRGPSASRPRSTWESTSATGSWSPGRPARWVMSSITGGKRWPPTIWASSRHCWSRSENLKR
jgi:hypothetical protein